MYNKNFKECFMTEINPNLMINGTLAGQIAQKLDAKDGKKDNSISGLIWNEFVEEKGTGKAISQNGTISIDNALKSISTYLVRIAKTNNKNIDELANEWLNKFNTSETATTDSPTTTNSTETTNTT